MASRIFRAATLTRGSAPGRRIVPPYCVPTRRSRTSWNTSTRSDALRVTERFTAVDPDTIAIEVTLDDPKVYTKPWKTAGAFVRGGPEYQVFEYACHEGNLGMENLSFRIPRKK